MPRDEAASDYLENWGKCAQWAAFTNQSTLSTGPRAVMGTQTAALCPAPPEATTEVPGPRQVLWSEGCGWAQCRWPRLSPAMVRGR